MNMEEVRQLFEGVYKVNGKLATLNSANGSKIYNEELVSVNSKEYRLWNPYRSKLAAAILNGLKGFRIKEDSNVLYLGAATGTTSSHVSDIACKGKVFCVEFSERNMRELLKACEKHSNMLPILANANNIEEYEDVVGKVDIMYQDVSARNQSEILMKNSSMLEKGGYAYFAIKSQSIDISKSPKKVFQSELAALSGIFEVEERIDLEPFDSLHLFSVLRKL